MMGREENRTAWDEDWTNQEIEDLDPSMDLYDPYEDPEMMRMDQYVKQKIGQDPNYDPYEDPEFFKRA